jgi:hypothetical protein
VSAKRLGSIPVKWRLKEFFSETKKLSCVILGDNSLCNRAFRLFRQELKRAAHSKKLFKELQFTPLTSAFGRHWMTNTHTTLNFCELYFQSFKRMFISKFPHGVRNGTDCYPNFTD